MKVNINQLDQAQLALAIQQYSSGSAFSGNFVNYVLNGGFLGNQVLSLTGGAQLVSGVKSFVSPIGVPYAGGTGDTVAQLYVTNSLASLSGILNASINAISGAVESGSSAFTVTGSSIIDQVDITGLGGTRVIWSGGKLFISGAGSAAGGGSNVQVTGSSAITTPNLTGAGNVTLSYNGTYVIVSGNASAGGGAPNAVFQTGDQNISGFKTFTGSIQVAAPTTPSGAVNLVYLSGFSGVWTGQMTAMSGILYAQMTGISGAVGGGVAGLTNIFYITGSGTINNTFNASGSITNTFNSVDNSINIGAITGNFVEISFFSDPVSTGLNIFETFVSHNFFFTGAAFACRTTGFGPVNGGIMSGKLYQVDFNNTEQTLYQFAFQSGTIYSGSPTFNVLVTGRNRVGLSITNSLSGIEKLTIGLFGGSYA